MRDAAILPGNMSYSLPVALLALMLCSACLTSRNSKAIQEYRSPINEFDRSIEPGTTRISTGTIVMAAGRTTVQFADVLLGAGRFLNVEQTAAGVRFYETAERLSGGTRAFLLRQTACCLADKPFRLFLFSKPGEAIELPQLLKENFNYDTGKMDYPTALVVMNFTNVYSFQSNFLAWQTNSGLSLNALAPLGDYETVMKDIAWRERSRASLAMHYAYYLITVPVDIITGPVQIAALLFVGKGFVK